MPSSLVLKLVRHGQSTANTDEFNPQIQGDFRAPLTALGREQARAAGAQIGREFLEGALVYASPYLRAQQTLAGIFEATQGERLPAGIYEDPRLREVDHGYTDVKRQESLRERHGWFYYRYEGGESPADCYDRVSGFLETLMRQVERKVAQRVLVVSHGLALRCFVMRFLHMTVAEFETVENPHNGAVVTIAPRGMQGECVYEKGRFGVSGLTFRSG